MQGNYEKLLERIARSAGLMKEDVEKKVEAKREKLSGLISKEGAAQVVASELGVSFEGEKLMIDELLPGMRNVNLVGKVINLTPVRTFKTKGGEESKVTNLWIADETSNIRAVLWDTNHIGLIEKGEVKEGSVVEISNGSMRDSELHLGSFSEFKLSKEEMDDVKTEKIVREKNIIDFKKGENTSSRAFVVQIFEPKFFNVCPECKRKVVQEGDVFSCGQHSKVIPEKRALVNLVLDDGTESIRSVIFHEKIPSLGLTDLENSDLLTQQKQNLLGKEMLFAGNVRNNAFFNTPEFIIDDVKELNLDEVIQSLEK